MLKYTGTFFFLSMLFLFSNCSKSSKSQYGDIINNWIGKKVILPILNSNYDSLELSSDLKIVTRINGDCHPCLMQLKNWLVFLNDVSKEQKVSFYIYVVISDTLAYNEINRKEIHLNYPVIFDQNDQFRKLNGLHKNEIFHTMLLNHSNNVIIIGNPIYSQKIKRVI